VTAPDVAARAQASFDPPLEIREDMMAVRQAFAALMDRVTADIQALGLDSDDCVMERSATVRIAGSTRDDSIPAEFLASRGTFLKPLLDNSLRCITPANDSRVVFLVTACVEAFRAPDYPQTTPLSSD